MAGRIAAGRGLAITYKMQVQQPTKTFCNFMQKRLAKNTESSSDNTPGIGAEKEIVYDLADPSSAEIAQNTSENVILVIMGIIFLVMAVATNKKTKRKAILNT